MGFTIDQASSLAIQESFRRARIVSTMGESLPGALLLDYVPPDLGQHLSKLGEWGVRIAQPHRSPVEAMGVIEVSRTVELHHNIGPTSVGVNTFSTIALLTLITNCDGGAI